jgi:Domain of unknown function (DUF3854)
VSDETTDSAADLCLLPHHVRELRNSGLSDETIGASGIRSLTEPAKVQDHLRWKRSADRLGPCLAFPYPGPDRKPTDYVRLKPDKPRNGKKNRPIKYEAPVGQENRLYVPWRTREALRDAGNPLVITEGEKKALKADQEGFPCVGLGGVWAWQLKRPRDKDGRPQGERQLIPDLDQLLWKGRSVSIVFDSDAATNPKLRQAERHLAAALTARGATVRIVRLPGSGEGDGSASKVGLDDFLVRHPLEDLQRLLDGADPPEGTGSGPDGPLGGTREAGDYVVVDGAIHRRKPVRDGTDLEQLCTFDARINEEVVLSDGSGEDDRRFVVEGRLADGTPLPRVELTPVAFSSSSWALQVWGAPAVVMPYKQEHLRCAIQMLSGKPRLRVVYGHTGWREIGGSWYFLHAGGAIGPNGLVQEAVEVSLPQALARYRLPAPPGGEDLKRCVRAVLELIRVTHPRLTFPLLGSVFRAAIGGTDFSVHLVGPTGVFKSELAALFLRFFGPEMDGRHLPANWSSTGNFLELLAFGGKDVVLVIDEFTPVGNPSDVQRWHASADRVLRAQGNGSARQRLNSSLDARPARPPRGLILSTGEDTPRGSSLGARMLVLDMALGDIATDVLTARQQDAAEGRFAGAMSAFLRSLAPRYGDVASGLGQEREGMRQRFVGLSRHARTPGIAADLAIGLKRFLDFAIEAGAATKEEAERLELEGLRAITEACEGQAEHISVSEPAGRFMSLLRSAISSGRAHVAGADGRVPLDDYGLPDPERWGWRAREIRTADGTETVYDPQRERVGWYDDGQLYLEPATAYTVVQQLAQAMNAPLLVEEVTLRRRLRDAGYLATTEQDRGKITVRKWLQKERRHVLHVNWEREPCGETGPSGPGAGDEGQNPDRRGAAAAGAGGPGEPHSGPGQTRPGAVGPVCRAGAAVPGPVLRGEPALAKTEDLSGGGLDGADGAAFPYGALAPVGADEEEGWEDL